MSIQQKPIAETYTEYAAAPDYYLKVEIGTFMSPLR